VKPVLIILGVSMVVTSIFGLGLLAWSFADQRDTAQAKLAVRLKADQRDAARLLPAPVFNESITYGPPYNVTVSCTVKGSRVVDGKRIPLDPNKAPTPGDLFVKTCVGLKPQPGGPVG
jgi:hypothetical protein